MRLIAFIALVAACATQAPAVEEPIEVSTPWCLRLVVRDDVAERHLLACLETESLCARARDKVISVGGLVHVDQVGDCSEVE